MRRRQSTFALPNLSSRVPAHVGTRRVALGQTGGARKNGFHANHQSNTGLATCLRRASKPGNAIEPRDRAYGLTSVESQRISAAAPAPPLNRSQSAKPADHSITDNYAAFWRQFYSFAFRNFPVAITNAGLMVLGDRLLSERFSAKLKSLSWNFPPIGGHSVTASSADQQNRLCVSILGTTLRVRNGSNQIRPAESSRSHTVMSVMTASFWGGRAAARKRTR